MSKISMGLSAPTHKHDANFRLHIYCSLPNEVARLRYDQFVKGQGKPYPTADHEAGLLLDEIDPLSVHIVCRSDSGHVVSALRLTPFDIASGHGFFSQVISNAEHNTEYSVVLSRLVRVDTMNGVRSVRHIFKFCFDYCRARDWAHGLLHTSPSLLPLFMRYGWRQAGVEFCDKYAGAQIPLTLNALDDTHLRQIKSPYLENRA